MKCYFDIPQKIVVCIHVAPPECPLQGIIFHPFNVKITYVNDRSQREYQAPIIRGFNAMANQELLKILKQGVDAWNEWKHSSYENQFELIHDLTEVTFRNANLSRIDFSNVNLSGADLSMADFSGASLYGADLSRANLARAYLDGTVVSAANFRGADLTRVDFSRNNLSHADLSDSNPTYLSHANLSHAKLRRAQLQCSDLSEANLTRADLGEADLRGANLRGAQLIYTNLCNAKLTGCQVHGVSVWDVNLDGAEQQNLDISPPYEAPLMITLDNLEVAQFIYLLLNNSKIRDVIDTVAKKVVLILGRFTPERKAILDAIREELRRRGFAPIIFDFDKPSSRNLTETVSTLAHLSRFVIADITDAKSIPQELQRIIPSLPSLPVQPLLLSSQHEYAMFKDFRDYPWVLSPHLYDSAEDLLASLEEKVITPPITKAAEIEERRKAFEEEISK